MRLRYLYLPKFLPLQDVEINFGYEPVLARACAIHFVVGVNGSGKSRLLRTLAEIFLSIERGRQIPFPVVLVYDLGPVTGEDDTFSDSIGHTGREQARHTIYLHRPEEGQTILVDFDYIQPDDEINWQAFETYNWETFTADPDRRYRKRMHYRGDNLPTVYLPRVLLAYTSGATTEWEMLFAPARTESQDILTTTFNAFDPEQERPADWDSVKEAERQRRSEDASASDETDEDQPVDLNVEYESARSSGIGIFVPPHLLKFALCAIALKQAAKEFEFMTNKDEEQRFRDQITQSLEEGRRMSGLRGLFNEVEWLWPITIGLRIAFRPERFTRLQTEQLVRLYRAATTVIREPEPGVGRQVLFDLRDRQKDENDQEITTAQALISALTPIGDDTVSAFGLFKQLLTLRQQGILEEITIALRKRNLDDLILYEWLSDGERVFLGRMAFFHLLQGTEDALILLDEPETHFNDFWKREMVDIIDTNLRDDPIDVVLSTHSSIALSDAFDTEMILLQKDLGDGSITAIDTPMNSFGASPLEIMRTIFDAPESVGQRAAEFLDLVLMIAAYPAEVRAVWVQDTRVRTLQELQERPEFERLREVIKIPSYIYRDEDQMEQLNTRLARVLRSVHRYTQRITGQIEVTIADALDVLQERIGPGYYQFEFRRRLLALRRDSNAASN